MLFIKLISYLDSIIHILYFVEHCSSIIRMTRPVYFATFYHQEKPFLIIFSKKINGTFCNLC